MNITKNLSGINLTQSFLSTCIWDGCITSAGLLPSIIIFKLLIITKICAATGNVKALSDEDLPPIDLPISDSGELWVWGKGKNSRFSENFEPRKISFLHKICSVCCSEYHILVCDAIGQVFSWGKNEQGVVGRIEVASYGITFPDPVPVPLPDNLFAVKVSCSSIHCLVLCSLLFFFVLFFRLLSKFFLEDGTVVSWGNNTYGQLGHDFNNILRVENIGYCTDIACGGANSYFLSYQQVFSCGNGEMGKLGHGSNMRTLRRPVRIEGLINYTVRNIYARVNNYAVVTGYSPSTLPLLSTSSLSSFFSSSISFFSL